MKIKIGNKEYKLQLTMHEIKELHELKDINLFDGTIYHIKPQAYPFLIMDVFEVASDYQIDMASKEFTKYSLSGKMIEDFNSLINESFGSPSEEEAGK